MIDTRPKMTPPLKSEELQHDADVAGVAGGESVKTDGDTHLPASESDSVSLPKNIPSRTPNIVLPPD